MFPKALDTTIEFLKGVSHSHGHSHILYTRGSILQLLPLPHILTMSVLLSPYLSSCLTYSLSLCHLVSCCLSLFLPPTFPLPLASLLLPSLLLPPPLLHFTFSCWTKIPLRECLSRRPSPIPSWSRPALTLALRKPRLPWKWWVTPLTPSPFPSHALLPHNIA